MGIYRVQLDGVEAEIEAENIEDALESAREWVRDGSWDLDGGTIWIDAFLVDEDGESECFTTRIDPEEPECEDGEEHVWESPHEIVGGCERNPGVWGNGGGVKIQRVCMRCGCGRLTDTWATRPDSGKQGLESVRYDRDYLAEAQS